MKNKWIIASILIVALIALCGASLYAAWVGVRMAQDSGVRFELLPNTVSAKATEQKTISVSSPASLSVISDLGDVSVKSGPDGQISVTAEKTAWGNNGADAQAALKDLKVIYDQTGSNLAISVQQPVEVNALHLGSDGGSVKFTVVVPSQTAVTLKSSAGDLSLSGTNGIADLRTEFGVLNLTDVSGEIFARSSNGTLKIQNIGDGHKIELSSEFGNITADTVQGSDVTISSTNGTLELAGIKASGILKATSEFGAIHVSKSSAGMADIHSNNGTVKLDELDLDGKIIVNSDFGDLILTKVSATAYDLESNNGKINVDGAQGPVKAHSEFGAVEVINAKNATLDLLSNNGGVTFSGTLGAGPHSIKSEFGNITLNLPADLSLNVDLQTEFGKITSDFDVTVSGNKMDEKHWTGKINGGGAELIIKNSNGNITLHISK